MGIYEAIQRIFTPDSPVKMAKANRERARADRERAVEQTGKTEEERGRAEGYKRKIGQLERELEQRPSGRRTRRRRRSAK